MSVEHPWTALNPSGCKSTISVDGDSWGDEVGTPASGDCLSVPIVHVTLAADAQWKVPMSTQIVLYDEVCRILVAMLGEEGAVRRADLSRSTSLQSLGMDSMKYINLLLSLEDIIGKELDEVAEYIDLSEITTVGDLVTLVERLRDL
ncbi:acyl carrier protein [Solwaraspora sp. WMMD792]|uniref:acyl carrier protein n=2 Tax=unclassified Solwaraspora TaxID=2627926 RepID=UPI002415F791|nr:acyl carrier protein [Solwaraspora sp. WMMD792]MDG4771307.1 acyl carrier protein [Solwaraspora sp. WMMD792]